MDSTGILRTTQTSVAGRTPKQEIHYTVASARERVSRYWMAQLVGSEFKVLNFVLERTLPFGKQREVIPLRHFIGGVWTRDGSMVTAGTGLSRRAVLYAIGGLLERGLLTRWDRAPRIGGHAQDAHWFALNFKTLWQKEEDMLRTPKRLKPVTLSREREEFEEGGCKKRTPGGAKIAPRSNRKIEAIEETPLLRKGVADATAMESVISAADQALARNRARRQEKLKRAEAKFTLMNFNKMWQSAQTNAFPRTPVNAISVRSFAIVRSSLKTYKLSVPFNDFLGWFFDGYAAMRTSKRFAWINKNADLLPLPPVPTPDVLVRYFKHFVAAHEASVQSGYNERAVDWKLKADEAIAQAKQRDADNARMKALLAEQKAKVDALERDKRALQQKSNPVSQIDLDDAPVRRRRVDIDSDDLGEWGKK
jgi:hypothetical protein